VVVGDNLAIPTGTMVEGTLEKTSHGHWPSRRAEIHLRLASLVFADGYKVSLPGNLVLTTDRGRVYPTYGVLGFLLGWEVGVDTTVALVNHGGWGAIAPGIAGTVAGNAIAIPFIAHFSGVFMKSGTPFAMVLESPLTVERERVLNTARH
jgi:hypothetical protein